MDRKTTVFENSLIWFGAGVSIAEIITGTYLAPLGFAKGMAAVIIGHVIGCALLFAAGVIGGRTERSAMETVRMSFGKVGCTVFSILNIMQLFGWTAIMIYDGAVAADGIFSTGIWLWSIVIGSLVILWIVIGVGHLGRLNTVAMALLFILTIILSFIVFRGKTGLHAVSETLSFGAALELSIAMPLSWLPVISDYTREAKEPVKATLASSVVYGAVSCWMYLIGMGAALLTGQSDIASIMLKAGLGIAGLLIVVLSTVTTTFLDAYSAGVSSVSLSDRINPKVIGVLASVCGILGAIFLPLYDITDFLYLIGSVFAPMIAVQIADYFFLGNTEGENRIGNMVIWAIGFAVYRLLMRVDWAVGSTVPAMAVTMILVMIYGSMRKKRI